ncbi:MAG: hypothetical protein WBB76_08120 [Gaiellaceae bacterium]
MNVPQHRADAVFALPRLPATARLLGNLPGWAEDLSERRIEVVGSGERADVVVADPAHATDAAALDAPSLIVDGRARLASEIAARHPAVMRLLPVPLTGSPVLFVNLGHRRAARYAIERGVVHAERWRNARNRAAALLAEVGALPAPRGAMGLAAAAGPPALVAAAADLSALPDPQWALLVSLGSIVRRDAFLLFPAGSRTPAYVLKFSRVPGFTAQFDRDERGAEAVRRAGGIVARHAPSYLGRLELDGRPASLETAAVGMKLTSFLGRMISGRAKLAAVEPVAAWLIALARETVAPPEALAPERERIEREVLPAWNELLLPADLLDRIPPIPATFLHNDVAEENIVVSDDGFIVLDWEWAHPHGLPLSDLLYFGVHVLRIIDGALTEEERDRHFVEVLAGNAQSSPVLFRWVRELVSVLDLPPDSVGPLATVSWLDRGLLSLTERRRAEEVGGAPLDPAFAERVASKWMQHPALGPSWSAWR